MVTDYGKPKQISIVDLSDMKIINGNIRKRIKDLEIQLNIFHDEIDWWFDLLKNTAYPKSIGLRKPIVIELYEFIYYMRAVTKQIKIAVRIINKIYEGANHKPQMEPLESAIAQTFTKWDNELKLYRNTVAAHRFTTKDGKFLKLSDVMKLFGKISDENLTQAKNELFDCHDKIKSWLANPANRDLMVLVSKMK